MQTFAHRNDKASVNIQVNKLISLDVYFVIEIGLDMYFVMIKHRVDLIESIYIQPCKKCMNNQLHEK